ncbi:MAG: fused DSP-PTPase phosphatase/NAD kinase-like protein [Brevundimonas sp.]
MGAYDLSSATGRFRARWDYVWKDHGFIRRFFMNAHWVGPDMVRTNQPSPRQLAFWKARGIRTVINLRGVRDEAWYALEKAACEELGLTLIDAPLDSRDAPTPDRIHRARALFRTIDYPVLIHCKAGADRSGLMAVLYRHFHLGEPIAEAIKQLDRKYLHHRQGLTGILDYTLEKYMREVEPTGVSFLDWIDSDAYDPRAIRAEFRAGWWGTVLTERLLRRE